MNTSIQHLATQLYSPLFGDRDLKVAYDLAISEAQDCANPAAMVTAIHVLMNSIALEIEKRNNARLVVPKGKRYVDPEATADEQARRMGL